MRCWPPEQGRVPGQTSWRSGGACPIGPGRRPVSPPVSGRAMRGGVSRVTGNFRCSRLEQGQSRPAGRRRLNAVSQDQWVTVSPGRFPVIAPNRAQVRRNRAQEAREQGRSLRRTG
jgi:hypothetical protein